MPLSSRQNPPQLSLHLATSFDDHVTVRTPLLPGSPLPSPGLPSIFSRHGKKKLPKLHTRRALQLLAWLTLCLLLFLFAGRIVWSDQRLATVRLLSPDSQEYQVVGDSLPEQPSPILVTDQRGRSKWTISIPSNMHFPLKPAQYAGICKQSKDLSMHVAMLKKAQRQQSPAHHTAHHPYYYRDPHFIDIAEAESHNLLPDHTFQKPLTLPQEPSTTQPPLEQCARTLTYALQTSDAGLGRNLLTLWLAYGLAQSENRTFFIDDTNWPYGSYSTYFQPPPSPGCLPPPQTHAVPCPHQARHLLVSAATTRQTFGHSFVDHFEDAKEMGVMRQHKIFGMMRVGYEALFQGKLNDEDEAYLRHRVAELDRSTRSQAGKELGVHVRHGDRHPLEHKFKKSYIPLNKYLNTAYNLSSQAQGPRSSSSPTRILIASDDPDVYADPLITHASASNTSSSTNRTATIQKAQAHVNLTASDQAGPDWHGGFFKDVFWGLDDPPSSPPPNTEEEDSQPQQHEDPSSVGTHTISPRSLIARAYLLDLAVLGQTDAVVCALSAYGCRILAIMMGWERAIVGGGWINIDGDFEWRGIDW